MEQLQMNVMMDPENEEKVKECDEAEEELVKEEDFLTAADRPHQVEY